MRVPLLCLFLLAACGGSSPQATTPTNTTPAEHLVPVPPAEDPKAACANHPDEYGPYVLSADQARNRYGMAATKFTDTPTTKDKTIEVCGIPAQQAWLMNTSCADGSKAFTSAGQVQGSRRGNVGEGGRCGAIIDLYVANCPEAEYAHNRDTERPCAAR